MIDESGKHWKLIAASLRPYDRTSAMVRNRYLRIQRGRWLTEQGQSKNKCGHCGKLKRGHVCNAILSKLHPEAAAAIIHVAALENALVTVSPQFEGGGNPMDILKQRVSPPDLGVQLQESKLRELHSKQAYSLPQLQRLGSLEVLALAAAGVTA